MKSTLAAAVILLSISAIAAPSRHQTVSVTISPTSASLNIGGTKQFTATVTDSSNTAVAWSASGGKVSSSGLYTAPSTAGTFTVTATSKASRNASASATVTVTALEVVAITISPTSVSMPVGTAQQFTAAVTGTTDTAVAWSVSESCGSITTSGLYTAPASAELCTVTATSQANTSVSASATVTVTAATLSSIAVTPNPASVAVGGTVQLTATGTYSNESTANLTSSVTWASSSTAVATVSSSGLATGVATGTASITATSGSVVSPGDTLTVTESSPAPVITPGWTFLQDINYINGGASSTDYAWEDVCSSSSTTCSIISAPTTAGSVWIAFWGGEASTSQIKITSVCSEVAPSTCTGTNNGWTLVPSSACASFISGEIQGDCAYSISGSSGQSEHTITFSAAPSAGAYAGFVELLPPAGYTASYDTAGVNTNGGTTCSSCSTVNLGSLGGTDAIFQFADNTGSTSWASPGNPWGSPYITDSDGNGIYLNATSGAAPANFSQSPAGHFFAGAIAFKSTAGHFTGPTLNYSLMNLYEPQTTSYCAPTCTLTIPTPTAGNLLFVEAADIDSAYISSATLGTGNSLTVPSGCEVALYGTPADVQSCAYIVVPSGAGSTLSVTMNKSAVTGIVAYEVHRNTGTWTLDAVGATSNIAPTSTGDGYMNGQSLASGCSGCSNAITGTDDVIFQGIFDPGQAWITGPTLYPYPYTGLGYGTGIMAGTGASSAALLNTASATAPVWTSSNRNSYVSVIAAAFK